MFLRLKFITVIVVQGGHFNCNGDYIDITLPVTYKNQCLYAEATDVLWAETTSFKISYAFIWNFGLKDANSKIRFLNTNKDIGAGAVKYFSLGV